jgi:hypothetical protein
VTGRERDAAITLHGDRGERRAGDRERAGERRRSPSWRYTFTATRDGRDLPRRR